jgi:Trk K+ transport system NAD-binding subunit
VLSALLRRPGLVPGDLANLVSLAAVWTAFGIAEWLQSEAGIMSAVAMGLAMQRGVVPEEQRLRRFKEQLTVLGISLLFVLLAADLPLGVVVAEGWRGFLTVATLMLVVRPLSVAISLRGSSLSIRERAYVAWIAPRGIVAASVASLFAIVLRDAGFAEGERILAITFLTIAMTVTFQGLTAGVMASLLGLSDMTGRGVVIVGAGPLGLRLALLLRDRGRRVSMIDRNPFLVQRARSLGFEVVEGNALDEDVLQEAQLDQSETLVAVTTNAEVNAFASLLAHDAFGVARSYPALGDASRGAGPRLLERVGGRIAFGRPIDVRAWDEALEHGEVSLVVYRVPPGASSRLSPAGLPELFIAVARARADSIEVTNAEQRWRAGDEVIVLSLLSDVETVARLEESAIGGGSARTAATVQLPDAPPASA